MKKVLNSIFEQDSNHCLASVFCVGESATSRFNEMGISVNIKNILGSLIAFTASLLRRRKMCNYNIDGLPSQMTISNKHRPTELL